MAEPRNTEVVQEIIPPELDSDNDSEEFRDALDQQMRQLELDGKDSDFQPAFQSLEEAKREIERAGEEYRLQEELNRSKQEEDQFETFRKEAEAEEELEIVNEPVDDDPDESPEKKEDFELEARRKREENLSEEELLVNTWLCFIFVNRYCNDWILLGFETASRCLQERRQRSLPRQKIWRSRQEIFSMS